MSEMAEHDRTLSAVNAIAELVRARRRRLVEAMEEVATTARACRDRELPRLEERPLGDRIEPVDPSALTATALQILDYQTEEIRWTRWLHGILCGRGGDLPRRILYAALRDILVQADPAIADAWSADPDQIADVRTEVRTVSGARLDLVLSTTNCLVVVENKLLGGWNDGPGSSQADAYVGAAEVLQLEAKCSRTVLALLTLGDAAREHARWTKVRYARLATRLRSLLKANVSRDADIAQYLELAPIFELVREIERVVETSGPGRNASPWERYRYLRANAIDAEENAW